MRKFLSRFLFLFIIACAAVPFGASAKLGVGVGAGKIEFNEPLKMGGIYTFPPLTVINTGDEAGEFGAGIDFKEDQPLMSPSKEWFTFTPEIFYLEPGQSQVVQVQANIPIKAIPGDYFAYLEGHPVKNSQSAGGVVIGISAATKMYFNIAPANIFQGIYYRTVSIIKNNAPWSYVVLIVIAASSLIVLFRRYFSFNIGISRKPGEKSGDEKK